MRPLLRARPLLLHRFAKGHGSSRQRTYIRRLHVFAEVLFDASDRRILKRLTASQPFRRWRNFRPGARDIAQTACRESAVGEIRLPPCFRRGSETRVRFAPSVNEAPPRIIARQLEADV